MRTVRHAILLSAPFALVVACNMGSESSTNQALPGDCGGPGEPACGERADCLDNGDCGPNDICADDGKCSPAACINGVQDGTETDVDCGGATCPKCADGKRCDDDASCKNGWCNGGICTEPRCDDGVKNGFESDVDCGGPCETGCPAGKACNDHDDCASGGCSYQKVCVDRPSCTEHHGGDTCGGGETGQAGAQHESCCTALELPVPNKPVIMDKYQITAGRFRRFLDAVDGNVRAFVQQRRPVGWDPTWDDFVPNGWEIDPTIPADSDPEYLKRPHSSVWHQLGGTALLHRLGRDGKPFLYGCHIAGNGTHTYRMPDHVQTDILKDIPHKYSQEVLDEKALNCVTSIMLAAFCEWDWPGSRLPTYAETRFAWHKGEPANHMFPWGNAPAPVGYQYPNSVYPASTTAPEPTGRFGEFAVIPVLHEGMPGELDYANWKYNYVYPRDPWPSEMAPDQSAYISAPGRFPKGNGPFGHADLAGNLFDLTSTIAGSPGQHPDDREVTWGRNGAWEGHPIPFAGERGPWTAPIMRKYGKTGGRCVKEK
jgi:formylglycine-generating enzyme required for sulfatase activity